MTDADPRLHALADVLLDLEAELRRLELWEDIAPSPEQLQSELPFCYDTATKNL